MTTFRVTELWCDLCDLRHVYDNLVEATANGWRHTPSGFTKDLCPRCADEVREAS